MDTVSRQLEAYGTTAYQSGHYIEAMRCFNDLVQYEPDDWRSRLFLAMCLVQTKDFSHARHELMYIAEHCPVERYRDKAIVHLRTVMYAEQRSRSTHIAHTTICGVPLTELA